MYVGNYFGTYMGNWLGYQGLQQISSSLIPSWNVNTLASTSLSASWNTNSAVSPSNDLNISWNLNTQANASLIISNDVVSGVSNDISILWDSYGSVSKILTIAYQVGDVAVIAPPSRTFKIPKEDRIAKVKK